MEQRATDLITQGDQLFGKRLPLMSLWQSIADNFYVERADFTLSRSLGAEFAAHLMTSYPLLARRDLGNSFSAMLRPTAKDWFHTRIERYDDLDEPGRAWLERVEGIQRRAMYDRASQFVRATKEGDHDFAAFGQCVISVQLNRNRDGLLYRNWHLRDVAWCEGPEGNIDTVHRKWKLSALGLKALFPRTVGPEVLAMIEQNKGYDELEIRHAVIPADKYEQPAGGKKWRTRFVSVYIDVKNGTILEEVGSHSLIYVIPRWQTVSGSQYAYSPATVIALPDSRLIQAMTLTLLEAGQKAVNPPMIATQEMVRSDVNLYEGGITWVDAEYDERLGEVLRPISLKTDGIPMGLDMVKDTREMIAQAFFLNKLTMPHAEGGPEMTAFEVGQRVQQYIREALPLFEPMEMDYNGGLRDATFDLLLQNGAFGSPDKIPPSLKGADVQFRFESPLNEMIEKQKVQVFAQTGQLLAQAAALDPAAPTIVDAQVALRDALRGNGTPAKWMRTEEQVAQIAQAAAAKQQEEEVLGKLGQAADVAQKMGDAGTAINGALAPQGAA